MSSAVGAPDGRWARKAGKPARGGAGGPAAVAGGFGLEGAATAVEPSSPTGGTAAL